MTSSHYEPVGTSSEATTRTHLVRSAIVVVPAVVLLAAFLWAASSMSTNEVSVAREQAFVASQVEVGVNEPNDAASHVAPALGTQVLAESPSPRVKPPILAGLNLVTAGEPVQMAIEAPDGLQLVDPPASGLVQLEASGTSTYVPDAGFVGLDTFTVQSCNEGGCGEAGRRHQGASGGHICLRRRSC